jgi:hypothetical protein
VHKALARETQLKGWTGAKKIALLEPRDPHWKDLASEWCSRMQPGEGRDASPPLSTTFAILVRAPDTIVMPSEAVRAERPSLRGRIIPTVLPAV